MAEGNNCKETRLKGNSIGMFTLLIILNLMHFIFWEEKKKNHMIFHSIISRFHFIITELSENDMVSP